MRNSGQLPDYRCFSPVDWSMSPYGTSATRVGLSSNDNLYVIDVVEIVALIPNLYRELKKKKM